MRARASSGALPAASLPLIAGVLAAFFELDNTGAAEKEAEADGKSGAKEAGKAKDKKVRVAPKAEAGDDEEEEESEPAKKRR